MPSTKEKDLIGFGIKGVISPEKIAEYMNYDGIGMSFFKGVWSVDTDVPSATQNTIAAADIVVMDHWSYDDFSEDYTVSDAIQERMDEYETRVEEAMN